MKELKKSCWGKEAKIEIVYQYNIRPIAHLKLLNGQEKSGCAGKLTDRYYVFEAIDKGTNEEYFFFVGYKCAEDLLHLINQPTLSLYDPTKSSQKVLSSLTKNGDTSNSGEINICSFNAELLEAINILCISWNTFPKRGLFNIISYTENNLQMPNYKGAIMFNSIVKSDNKNRTLAQMIDELKALNNLKKLSFDEINKYINVNCKKSYIK